MSLPEKETKKNIFIYLFRVDYKVFMLNGMGQLSNISLPLNSTYLKLIESKVKNRNKAIA